MVCKRGPLDQFDLLDDTLRKEKCILLNSPLSVLIVLGWLHQFNLFCSHVHSTGFGASAEQPEGRYMPPALCRSWSERLWHRIKCPSLIYSPFCLELPHCCLGCCACRLHNRSRGWEGMTQAPYPDQVPAPQMCLDKSRGKPGSCSAHTGEAGRATTAKGSWWNPPVISWTQLSLVSTQLWSQPCGTMKCAIFKTRKLQDVIYGNVCRIPWLC